VLPIGVHPEEGMRRRRTAKSNQEMILCFSGMHQKLLCHGKASIFFFLGLRRLPLNLYYNISYFVEEPGSEALRRKEEEVMYLNQLQPRIVQP
jgi:hypothetical protein